MLQSVSNTTNKMDNLWTIMKAAKHELPFFLLLIDYLPHYLQKFWIISVIYEHFIFWVSPINKDFLQNDKCLLHISLVYDLILGSKYIQPPRLKIIDFYGSVWLQVTENTGHGNINKWMLLFSFVRNQKYGTRECQLGIVLIFGRLVMSFI